MGVPSTGQQLAEIQIINFRYIRFSFRQQMFRESQRRQRGWRVDRLRMSEMVIRDHIYAADSDSVNFRKSPPYGVCSM